jgi:uncharacterized membrane protein YdjX (TVP38/TMEM64 family)
MQRDVFQVRGKSVFLLVMAVIFVAGAIYFFRLYNIFEGLNHLVNEKTHPVLFLSLMALLPCVGFPIIIFLVLAGAKFGLSGGLLVTTMTMVLHLSFSYFLGRSVLRSRLERALLKRNFQLPKIPENKIVPFTLLFVGLPGLPYAVKNYVLALAKIPFRYYFSINLSVNLLFSIPIIGLGKSAANMNPWLFFLFLSMSVTAYSIAVWLRRKYDPVSE